MIVAEYALPISVSTATAACDAENAGLACASMGASKSDAMTAILNGGRQARTHIVHANTAIARIAAGSVALECVSTTALKSDAKNAKADPRTRSENTIFFRLNK